MGVGIKGITEVGEKLVNEQPLDRGELNTTLQHIGAEMEKDVVVGTVVGDVPISFTKPADSASRKEAQVAFKPESMNEVWDLDQAAYIEVVEGTSQYKAYEQLCLRQQSKMPILVCLHAGAGYGKYYLREFV